uniref:Uncharacterized protein n=1 Tax=Oryza punctata TaxID=4537 RepID=A0A0E0MEG6_ORYPU
MAHAQSGVPSVAIPAARRVATSQEGNMRKGKSRRRTCELILTVQQLRSSTPGGDTNKTTGGEVPGLLMVSAPTIGALDPEQWLHGMVVGVKGRQQMFSSQGPHERRWI